MSVFDSRSRTVFSDYLLGHLQLFMELALL